MHRKSAVLLLFLILHLTGSGAPAQAETLDRIEAVVDGRIITLSDIRNEREVMIVLGDTPGNDNAILETLVERYLLEEQIAQYPSLDVSGDEVNERMSIVTDFRGVAPAQIRDAIAKKIERRKYLDVRYRQFILVSNDEIKNYYEMNFLPEARKSGAPIPALDEVVDLIRENVFKEKVSRELDASLQALRARSNVEIFQ